MVSGISDWWLSVLIYLYAQVMVIDEWLLSDTVNHSENNTWTLPDWRGLKYTHTLVNMLIVTCIRKMLLLTHWGRDKMDAISQTTLSIAFSWMKMLEFWLNFHWSLFLRVQLTMATSHYLNQWWLVYWCIYASLGLNELKWLPSAHRDI